jgi:UDP-N-acetylglucosamine 4,6-dehydratase
MTITDLRMTRFWITIDQAVQFVIDCLDNMGGGEVFVPKIPSARVIDIATAIAPEAEHRLIGVRPGEKLNELLVTEDESRHSFECEDRFVVLPEYASWPLREVSGGRALDAGFRYSSDLNDWWLSVEELKELVFEARALR